MKLKKDDNSSEKKVKLPPLLTIYALSYYNAFKEAYNTRRSLRQLLDAFRASREQVSDTKFIQTGVYDCPLQLMIFLDSSREIKEKWKKWLPALTLGPTSVIGAILLLYKNTVDPPMSGGWYLTALLFFSLMPITGYYIYVGAQLSTLNRIVSNSAETLIDFINSLLALKIDFMISREPHTFRNAAELGDLKSLRNKADNILTDCATWVLICQREESKFDSSNASAYREVYRNLAHSKEQMTMTHLALKRLGLTFATHKEYYERAQKRIDEFKAEHVGEEFQLKEVPRIEFLE